jgi:hypothetical protein
MDQTEATEIASRFLESTQIRVAAVEQALFVGKEMRMGEVDPWGQLVCLFYAEQCRWRADHR